MMSMNGFTLGFFFPKQDFVRPLKETAQPEKIDIQPKNIASSADADDVPAQPAPFSLYAYRFF
jgi:hypothetical protein